MSCSPSGVRQRGVHGAVFAPAFAESSKAQSLLALALSKQPHHKALSLTRCQAASIGSRSRQRAAEPKRAAERWRHTCNLHSRTESHGVARHKHSSGRAPSAALEVFCQLGRSFGTLRPGGGGALPRESRPPAPRRPSEQPRAARQSPARGVFGMNAKPHVYGMISIFLISA